MKHTIEFWYDGGSAWAINGGVIVGGATVRSYIGREAFYEALKSGNSFKATMTVKVEKLPLEEN